MPNLSLSVCPVCDARDSLSRQSATVQDHEMVWYECQKCSSFLLWAGDDQWLFGNFRGPPLPLIMYGALSPYVSGITPENPEEPDQWIYQKVGRQEKVHLLKQPFA